MTKTSAYPLAAWGKAALATGLCLSISLATRRFFELPGRHWFRRVQSGGGRGLAFGPVTRTPASVTPVACWILPRDHPFSELRP
jgi:hypothetical protein